MRDEISRSTAVTTDELWARTRFASVAAMVHQRSRDLSKITQDQMNFLAQRNNPGGKKTMKAYYWYICGQEYDAQHPHDWWERGVAAMSLLFSCSG